MLMPAAQGMLDRSVAMHEFDPCRSIANASVIDPLSHPDAPPYPLMTGGQPDRWLSNDSRLPDDPCKGSASALIQDAQQLLARSILLEDGNVTNMLLVAQTLGMAALFEALPLAHWHLAGQAIASLGCFQHDMIAGVKLLDFFTSLATAPSLVVRKQAVGAPMHGAVWFIMGTMNGSWPVALTRLCPGVLNTFNCMHGVGHGFLIKNAQPDYGPATAFPPGVLPLTSVSPIVRATDECTEADGRGPLAQSCLTGAYHGTMEYGDFSHTSAWSAPCTDVRAGTYAGLEPTAARR
jgi:hypothetical protein